MIIILFSCAQSVEQFLIDNHYHKVIHFLCIPCMSTVVSTIQASEVFHTHIVDDDKDGNYILMYVKDKQINSVI